MSKERAKDAKENALKTWMNEKITLSKKWIDDESAQKRRSMVQGAVHVCSLGENIGSEQNEERPVLVISNNVINSTGGNVIVIPLTSRLSTKQFKGKTIPKYRSHYFLYMSKYDFLTYNSALKCEDTITVSKIRLKEHLGNIDSDDLQRVLTRQKWVFNM